MRTKSPAREIRERDYTQCNPIFVKPRPQSLFAFGVIEWDNPPCPVFPQKQPTDTPRTDAGTSTNRMTSGLKFSLFCSAIVGSVGIRSTDEVALTRDSSSKQA